ncbi:hypothetical protein DPMN_093386 [Dreissena polymorpha]|uniref:Uncharacterized protein n=1 Tax=Dreissena polymorpha TaxID=45954 RepID=A0A9D4L2U7_DREPO|nr:hypothetical protein DPMN_093386 [Dreissena polymorpha]
MLAWFGHVTRNYFLWKIHQGTLEEGGDVERRKLDGLCKEWTSLPMDELIRAAHNRPNWRRISVSPVPHLPPTT